MQRGDGVGGSRQITSKLRYLPQITKPGLLCGRNGFVIGRAPPGTKKAGIINFGDACLQAMSTEIMYVVAASFSGNTSYLVLLPD